jgi:hypothetical protein
MLPLFPKQQDQALVDWVRVIARHCIGAMVPTGLLGSPTEVIDRVNEAARAHYLL